VKFKMYDVEIINMTTAVDFADSTNISGIISGLSLLYSAAIMKAKTHPNAPPSVTENIPK
jgi:hypothetical protein